MSLEGLRRALLKSSDPEPEDTQDAKESTDVMALLEDSDPEDEVKRDLNRDDVLALFDDIEPPDRQCICKTCKRGVIVTIGVCGVLSACSNCGYQPPKEDTNLNKFLGGLMKKMNNRGDK